MRPRVEVAHEQLDKARKLLHRIRTLDNAHVRKGGSTAFSSGPVLNPFCGISAQWIQWKSSRTEWLLTSHRISPRRTVGRCGRARNIAFAIRHVWTNERGTRVSISRTFFSAEKWSSGAATDIPFCQHFFLREDSGLPARLLSLSLTHTHTYRDFQDIWLFFLNQGAANATQYINYKSKYTSQS